MPDVITVTGELPPLRDPVLLAAFRGWTDPGGASVSVLRYLAREWNAEVVAEVDTERFYDFTVQRPMVRSRDGERTIRWPRLRIHLARPPGAERDFLLFFGREPALAWSTLAEAVTEFARDLGASTSVSLGAIGGAVPHTRPSPVMLWAAHPELQSAFGLDSSFDEYEGPVGFQNTLTLHHGAAGWRTAFLFALAPHYLQLGPNPNVTLPLVQALDRAFGASTPTERLEALREEFTRRVRQAMEQTERAGEAIDYVQRLEQEYDSSPPTGPMGDAADAGDAGLPSAEEVLGDLERFLREQRGESD